MCVCVCSRSPLPLRGALLLVVCCQPRHYSHSCLLMVLLMVNKLLYAYASHCSITYRCISVLERVGGGCHPAPSQGIMPSSMQLCHAAYHVRKNAITLRAIVIPDMVVIASAVPVRMLSAIRPGMRPNIHLTLYTLSTCSARLVRSFLEVCPRSEKVWDGRLSPNYSDVNKPPTPKKFGTEAASRSS
jgi:hypothetical protein